MALFEVLDWSMKILEVETTTSVIAPLWGAAIDCLATRIQSPGQRDSRAHLHVPRWSASMMEALSDSIEENIFPAFRRSVGLTKSNGKRGERGQQERGVNGECVGRTLGVDWGMNKGTNDCHYRRSQWECLEIRISVQIPDKLSGTP
jgi:hypothetical protein